LIGYRPAVRRRQRRTAATSSHKKPEGRSPPRVHPLPRTSIPRTGWRSGCVARACWPASWSTIDVVVVCAAAGGVVVSPPDWHSSWYGTQRHSPPRQTGVRHPQSGITGGAQPHCPSSQPSSLQPVQLGWGLDSQIHPDIVHRISVQRLHRGAGPAQQAAAAGPGHWPQSSRGAHCALSQAPSPPQVI
jgi:hypothetical protein